MGCGRQGRKAGTIIFCPWGEAMLTIPGDFEKVDYARLVYWRGKKRVRIRRL